MSKTWKVVIGLAVGFFLLWNPMTRQIIKFVLPLGSGWDDFLEIALLVALVAYLAGRGWIKWNKTKAFRKVDRAKNTRKKQVAWVAIAFVLAWFYPGYLDAVGNTVLYGKTLDATFVVVFAITLAASILGWLGISYLDRRSSK